MENIYIQNKKVGFDYEILETLEAGIELLGLEVKSIRTHGGSLTGAYVILRGGEAFITNWQIAPFQEKNTPGDYDPSRARRLLLNKDELAKLSGTGASGKAGLTIVPISIYNKGGKIKIKIAIVRGKKKHDKRQKIIEQTTKRESARDLRKKIF